MTSTPKSESRCCTSAGSNSRNFAKSAIDQIPFGGRIVLSISPDDRSPFLSITVFIDRTSFEVGMELENRDLSKYVSAGFKGSTTVSTDGSSRPPRVPMGSGDFVVLKANFALLLGQTSHPTGASSY